MLKPSRNPYGFKNLLAYKKAKELQHECQTITKFFPRGKTMIDLADQMNRSARSGKQNIVEGWKRNTTKEYYTFLGFSIGAVAELEEDCNDIWAGVYQDLMRIRGVMGEMGEGGERGVMGERGERGERREQTPSPHNLSYLPSFDIEKLKFYPLDKTLPPIIQLKLKAKELNFLLNELQKSLEQKMRSEKTLGREDRARDYLENNKQKQNINDKIFEQYGLRRLENRQVVDKNDKGLKG